jgi:hypothetical protein
MLIKLDRLILYRNGFWSAHERPTPKLENCLPAYATSISKVASAEDPGLMILSTPSANHAPVWRREERGVEARSTDRAGIVDLEACRETKFGIRLAAALTGRNVDALRWVIHRTAAAIVDSSFRHTAGQSDQ